MSTSAHERVREFIAMAGGQQASYLQPSWLRAHLQECPACSDYAQAVSQIVGALHSSPVAADFALVQATQRRLRLRALELQQQQTRAWLVCLSCLFVGLSAVVTTPLFWMVFEWLGSKAGVANWVWQAAFAFFCIAPALVVSVPLLANGTHLSNARERQGI